MSKTWIFYKFVLWRSLPCVDAGCAVQVLRQRRLEMMASHILNVILCNKKEKTHRHRRKAATELVVRILEQNGNQWLLYCRLCFLIGSRTIYTANQWRPLTETPAHLFSPLYTHRHRFTGSRHSGETACASVSLCGRIINNAWLWEDERLFWLQACVSYGARETSVQALISIHSQTKWTLLHMACLSTILIMESRLIQA